MSRLKELINKLCPDGVEYVELGEAVNVIRGKRLTKNQLSEEKTDSYGIPVIHGGDTPMGYYIEANRKAGTTIVINTGTAGNVYYYAEPYWSSDACFSLYPKQSRKLLDRFLFFCVKTKEETLHSKIRSGAMPTIDALAVEKIRVPLPPIEIQKEIVEILDKFTEYDTELQSELQGRIKQYEYYRDRLLSFDTDIPKVKLGEAFYIKNGYTPSKSNPEYWEQGTIPWFRMEDIRGNGRVLEDSIQHVTPSAVKGELFPANSVILSTTATIGEPAYITVPFLTNQQITCIWPKEKYINKIDPKFVFYYSFRIGQWCKIISNKGGGLPIVNISKLKEYDFPLPPLAVQSRIVGVLDNFDKICSDLKNGLPAEIEKRQQQYEFYRDAILTFVEKR